MERRINYRMILVGLMSLVLTAALEFYVFDGIFDTQVREDLHQTGRILAQAYDRTGDLEFLKESTQKEENMRLTMISPDGEILYESEGQGPMGNHMDRPEVQEALETGSGEDVRTSSTVGYRTYYYALRLEDGTIMRIGVSTAAMYQIYRQAFPALFMTGVVVFMASLFLSLNLTRSLVKPILAMAESIDDIQDHVPYRELEPFAAAVAHHQARQKETERMRQDFTANVSHELKTPLTSISGYAEMIETGMAQEADVREFASRIRGESGRLLNLIGEILRLGELDYPVQEPECERLQVNRVAQTVLERLQFPAQKSYVTLKSELEPVAMWGDEAMLTEICYNLCDNAIRYNKPGGTVWLSVRRWGEDIRITVKDDGIGIPEEAQEHIFERFYRVDKSRSKETGGTGLGLAIVKHAVAQSGGRIQLKSRLGEGTEIAVTLPAEKAAVSAK